MSQGSGIVRAGVMLHDLAQFGVTGSGADESAKINAALAQVAAAGGGDVIGSAFTYAVSATIVVPSKVSLRLAEFSTIIPLANVNVVRQRASSGFFGKIDTSALAGWNAVALDFDGDSNNDPIPFRLHTPTRFEAVLVGAASGGNGTAVKLHADGVANARIMGVHGKARVLGFDKALWLRQTSADHSKFVTGCVIDIDASNSLQALYMESSAANGYDLDGNRIRAQLQPRPGTASIGMVLCGQANVFDLLPWDWDTVTATAPTAISITAGARRNFINTRLDPTNISNGSIERSNYIVNAWAGTGASIGEMRATAGDGVIWVDASNVRFDNGKGVLSRTADGLNEYLMMFTDASNNTYFQSMNVAGSSCYINARGSGAEIGFKFAGVTKASITSAGNFSAEVGSFNSGVTVRGGSTNQSNFFNNITAAAGAPTGAPTNPTGNVPLYYDSAANKLYVYNGAWKSTPALT